MVPVAFIITDAPLWNRYEPWRIACPATSIPRIPGRGISAAWFGAGAFCAAVYDIAGGLRAGSVYRTGASATVALQCAGVALSRGAQSGAQHGPLTTTATQTRNRHRARRSRYLVPPGAKFGT